MFSSWNVRRHVLLAPRLEIPVYNRGRALATPVHRLAARFALFDPPMNEAVLALLVVLALAALGAATLLPWDVLLQAGWALTLIGFVVGVPAGVVYHVLLHRALAPRGALEPGWIWRPIAQHVHLRTHERRPVLLWCRIGAGGFVVIALGLLAFGLSVVSAVARGV